MRNMDAIRKGSGIIFRLKGRDFLSVITGVAMFHRTPPEFDESFYEAAITYMPLSPFDTEARIELADGGGVYMCCADEQVFPCATWKFDENGAVLVECD